MTRVHFYVHGRGRGHGERSRSFIERLCHHSYEVRIFAGRDALSVFQDMEVERVESIMPGAGMSLPRALVQRIHAARRAMRREAPELLISDGDLPSIWAARLCKVPSIAIGHGLVFSHTRRFGALPRLPWLREASKARLASLGSERQIALSFVPLKAKRSAARVTFPPIREGLLGPRTPGQHILAYFRDSNASSILRSLGKSGQEVLLFSARDPQIEGITWQPIQRERFDHALKGARGVVSSAGSQLISECLALKTPHFVLYDEEDDEQALNVAMLAHFELGRGAPFLTWTQSELDAFLTGLPSAQERAALTSQNEASFDALHCALEELLARV